MSARMPFAQPRHDPWWDLDGSAVRRWRRVRILEAMVAWSSVAAVAVLAFTRHSALTAIL